MNVPLAVLLTCRNRRETTLAALRGVARQDRSIAPTVFLFDDASTDGTPAAVVAEFPEVRIVPGDGRAFWNGGLHRLWSVARAAPVDAFLWLNDDVALDDDAFARLADAWHAVSARVGGDRFILAGATRGDGGEVSYGGLRRTRRRTALAFAPVAAAPEPVPIDTFNGNIVLVPRGVVDLIGLNDPAFFHNMGDIDYGLRAKAAGVEVTQLPGTLGHCAANLEKRARGFGSPALTLAEQWRVVNTHRGLPPRSWWRLVRRHGGAWWPIQFLAPYRALLIPRSLRRRRA